MPHQVHKNDRNYPDLLKEIDCAPEFFYYEGDLHLLHQSCVAIVGSRNPTDLGKDLAFRFARELAEAGFVVVSGFAYGVDAAAHEGALSAGGKTIAVLGAGLDVPYPKGHQSLRQRLIQGGGLLVTEYADGTPALPGHFPKRNRIISGLSYGVLVVEATLKSGSLVTSKWAVDQNREVFAIPGALNSKLSEGPNFLIQKGAKLVQTVGDLISELPVQARCFTQKLETSSKKNTGDLQGFEKELADLLGVQPVSVDELVRRTGVEAGPLLACLLSMELKGLVAQHAGKRFCLKM